MAELIKTPDKTDYTAQLHNCGRSFLDVICGGSGIDLVPNFNSSRFDNEYFLNANPKWFAGSSVRSTVVDMRVDGFSMISGGVKFDTYIDNKNRLEAGFGFAEKPSMTNLSMELAHSDGMEFYYQPELTQEEIDEGDVRPDEVVGSYAIYIPKVSNKYRCGKYGHIYAPYFIDARGERRKCNLTIENYNLELEWGRLADWLKSCAYPIFLDPTFGGENEGGTEQLINDVIRGSTFNNNQGTGTITGFSGYFTNTAGASTKKLGIYDADDSHAYAGTSDERTGDTVEPQWYDFAVTGDPGITVTNGVNYALAGWSDDADGIGYDTDGNQRYYKGAFYGAWPDPFDGTISTGRITSIHVDFDVVGGAIPLLVGGGMGQTMGSNCNLMTG